MSTPAPPAMNPWDAPEWTPANKAELVAYAAAKGWSEDFDRFHDNDVKDWLKHWDPRAKMFRTEKKDAQGNPITGFVEKPMDVPEGWTAWGNFAIPANEAKQKMAAWGTPAAGAAPGSAPTEEAPASGSQLQYGGDELQNTLVEMFNRRGGIFGTGNPAWGATPRTGGANPINGVSLAGGGLWWGETGADTFNTKPAAPTAPAPQPSVAGTPSAPAPAQNTGINPLSTPMGLPQRGKPENTPSASFGYGPLGDMLKRYYGGRTF